MDVNDIKDTEKLQEFIDMGIEYAVLYLPKLVLAIIFLVVGLFVISKITKAVNKILNAKNIDLSLSNFLTSLIGWTLKALLFISVISMVGVATTSFVALIGAAGLAVGMALQGTLSNFAGGVMLMLFKPFKTGDFIVAQGEKGTVRTVDVFATHLNTLDNRRVILPNGPLASGPIVNVSAEDNRQVLLSVGIGYEDNIKTALDALTKMCHEHPKVLKTPESFVGVTDYGDSSINLTIRAWVGKENYWPVFFDLNKNIKPTLDKAGISIPFPQRDVHMIEQK